MHNAHIRKDIDHLRRRFGMAAIALAASRVPWIGSAKAQPSPGSAGPGANRSFGPLKQIRAGTLSVGYAEVGPADGPVVILLHGWPYDIHSFLDVAPVLAGAGHRVIVRTCAGMERRSSCLPIRRGMASNRSSRWTSSP